MDRFEKLPKKERLSWALHSTYCSRTATTSLGYAAQTEWLCDNKGAIRIQARRSFKDKHFQGFSRMM